MESEAEEQGTGFQPQDLWSIVRMQWRVVVACTVIAGVLALLHGVVATRQYKATAVVRVSPVAGQEMNLDRVVNDEYGRWNRQMFLQTQLEVLRSRTLLMQVIARFQASGHQLLSADNSGVIELRGMLETTPRVGTELLDISITCADPAQAAELAKLVAAVFKDSTLERRRDSARDAKKWLQGKIKGQNARIDDASRELVEFQALHGLADVDEAVTSLSARMAALNTAFAETNTQRVLLETTVRAHERALAAGQYEELAKDMDTTLVASLTADWARAVTEHAQISSRYGEKVQQFRSSQAQLDRIQEELRSEVERTLAAERVQLVLLKAKEASLQEEIDALKAVLLEAQEEVEQYEKLRMELVRARDFYVRLNQRNDELDLQSQTQLNNVQIVDDPEVPKRAVWPNVPLNLGLGLMGGVIAGLGFGMLREYIDDTVSSPLDVSTFLRVPFLGLIPQIEEETNETALALHTHEQPRSRVAEAMRAIRTVLELHPTGGVPTRLLVTSAVSSEGKTSTVVRLGVAFANLDKRVLMIDADLRKPRMHKIFQHVREPGLAGVLDGAAIVDAVLPTGVANLDYLPSGRGGDRPNELLASKRMRQLVHSLEDHYDLVIIDSPPSVILSDARILSRYVDGVVVVVREHTTARGLIREAIAALEQVGANMLGVIVNAVDLTHRSSSYKYYYGYGYGYGYGEDTAGLLEAEDEDEATEEPLT